MPGPPGIKFIPLDVRFGRDPKVLDLVVRHGLKGFAASDIYLRMACSSREAETDGEVTEAVIGQLAYPLPEQVWRELVGMLDEVGLIERASQGSKPELSQGQANPSSHVWIVRAYVKRNGTKEEHEERAAKLAEAGRRGGTAHRIYAGRSPRKPRLSQPLEPRLSQPLEQVRVETELYEAPVVPTEQQPERANPYAELGGQGNQWTTPPGARLPPLGSRGGHPSGKTVAEALRRPDGNTAPPATDTQREKHAAEARRLLAEGAAAAKATATAYEPPPPPEPFAGLPAPAGSTTDPDALGEGADVF